jgi:hypothetical protein
VKRQSCYWQLALEVPTQFEDVVVAVDVVEEDDLNWYAERLFGGQVSAASIACATP